MYRCFCSNRGRLGFLIRRFRLFLGQYAVHCTITNSTYTNGTFLAAYISRSKCCKILLTIILTIIIFYLSTYSSCLRGPLAPPPASGCSAPCRNWSVTMRTIPESCWSTGLGLDKVYNSKSNAEMFIFTTKRHC